jgi:hypothetical protein
VLWRGVIRPGCEVSFLAAAPEVRERPKSCAVAIAISPDATRPRSEATKPCTDTTKVRSDETKVRKGEIVVCKDEACVRTDDACVRTVGTKVGIIEIGACRDDPRIRSEGVSHRYCRPSHVF